ncbi:hypothetical protein psyc5s11_24810 [Clostridium gelidum]|uniref:Uncharacterized protein n=1 Tax=Clostridium gelidum TaxID=704125 RepID=A0ABN6IWG6_9CLOT|nr:hypothetical protein [Clostridium gelidum]BCZ46414.1 hypothetical protein psyc5s11_24810 [Clostridium gelidum]
MIIKQYAIYKIVMTNSIIGWVSEAENFYRKTVSAEYIKNGEPENSIYSNLIFMK